ncbi:MAG: hypothetical protein Q8N89_04040 [Azonexus sp.]|nr:hypothetical protein [Azonexus sp.]
MQIADYLETGAKKAGSLSALGRFLSISQPDISKAKNGKGRIPLEAAIMLADYIGADRIAVISANELATEKKEEKRAFWSHLLVSPNTSYIRQMMN